VQVSWTSPDETVSQWQMAALYEVQAPLTLPHDCPPPLVNKQYAVGLHEAVDGQSLQGRAATEQSRVGATFAETPAARAAHAVS
jgi:hypothetical protein